MSFLVRPTTIFLAATCLSMAACSDHRTDAVDNSIVFEPCEDTPTLDCGVFEVPLIHGSTDNRRLRIDVARLPGTGDGPHEPLLLNVGGPGSGTDVLREIEDVIQLPVSVRERYDIIGFDQRGVGNPLRVDCDQLGNAESSVYPWNQSEVMTLVDDATRLADACYAEYTDQLQWVGSNAVVQDMDIMRTGLNAAKLNIIGVSFGTRITALYLERYPDASGRIILDAPLRPSGNIDSLLLGTVEAQQDSFEQLLSACGDSLPDCDRTIVEAAFSDRVNSLLNGGDQDTFGAFFSLLEIAIDESDIGEFLAPLLIEYAFSGDPSEMFALIQEFGLNDDVGEEMDSITLERAVICADDEVRPSAESLVSTLNRLNGLSDIFAEDFLPTAASCVGWPEALDPVEDIRTADAPASLVIGGSGDVFTPITWAVETAESIGGVFLPSNHQGHTTVFNRENDCVDLIVVDFLLAGTLPPEGTSCN